MGVGILGRAESASLSVFTWLGNLALLYFLPEVFASAGLKASGWGAVACGFSAASLLARVIATHVDSICPFHGDAERAVWGLSSPGEQGGREGFPGGFLLALRLLHPLLDTEVGRFSQISLFHFPGNVSASV